MRQAMQAVARAGNQLVQVLGVEGAWPGICVARSQVQWTVQPDGEVAVIWTRKTIN